MAGVGFIDLFRRFFGGASIGDVPIPSQYLQIEGASQKYIELDGQAQEYMQLKGSSQEYFELED